MSRDKLIKCLECGSGRVVPVAKPGRYTSYKALARVSIPDELAVPTCDNCGAQWFDKEHAQTFDEALESEYRTEILRLAQDVLDQQSTASDGRWVDALSMTSSTAEPVAQYWQISDPEDSNVE